MRMASVFPPVFVDRVFRSFGVGRGGGMGCSCCNRGDGIPRGRLAPADPEICPGHHGKVSGGGGSVRWLAISLRLLYKAADYLSVG